jgi:hypothetical protein
MGRDDDLLWVQGEPKVGRCQVKKRDWLYWVLVVIAGLTIFSGLFQIVAPGFELRLLSVETTSTSEHLFATIGMFMVLFGGLFLNALIIPVHHPIIIFWGSLQKFGASAAVGLGVQHHIFSSLALLVATFDFCSGILGICYWNKIKMIA